MPMIVYRRLSIIDLENGLVITDYFKIIEYPLMDVSIIDNIN